MQKPGSRTGRWSLPLALSIGVVALGFSSVARSTPAWSQSSPLTAADIEGIREAVVRYQAAHLTPGDVKPSALSTVVALCVGFEKSGGVDPSPTFIASLKDVQPPVVAYSSCVRDGFQGRLPIWVTSIEAQAGAAVQARGRSVQNYYVYALERQPTGWAVTKAQLTGRGAPANKPLQPTSGG